MIEFCPRDRDIAVVCNWIWGTPLHKYLERAEAGNGRRLSPYEATRLYYRFVNGLSELHSKDAVVHADIKPENLIRTQKNRLVLIDFGAAWTLERMVDYDPCEGSSPPYAAPEVLRGGKPTPASDQFSATAVYYRMLTGQVPYDKIGGQAGAGETEPSVAFDPPSRFAPRRDGTPRRFWKQIDAIAQRGLDLDPLQRYASRSEWLDAIDELWIGLKTENRLSGRNQLLVDLIQKASRLFGRSSLFS
jgi:serine/threonine protein kinase